MLDYQNTDHAALSWDQAAEKLGDGDCAFYSMGDWVYGELIQNGLEENVDFGWVAHPGSEGTFLLVTDGFTLAKNAPNPTEAVDLLRTMGDRVVQEDFNLIKGSICARTDCDRSRFGPYLQWSMDRYAEDVAVPTVIHGSAAPPAFQPGAQRCADELCRSSVTLRPLLNPWPVRRMRQALVRKAWSTRTGLVRNKGLLILLPSLLLTAIFVYGFIGTSFFYSLTNWRTLAVDLSPA